MNLMSSFERIRERSLNMHDLSSLHHWLMKYTFIEGKNFNFKDREFQIPILTDTAKTSIIVKCAQVGLSELAYRWAVAACCVMKNFTVIYTFPTTTDAEHNCVTRINPMIEGSEEISRSISQTLNNTSIKQFGENSFLFFKGTISKTQALSTPADAVINDEFDKSDIEQASVYVSRLQDKIHKIRKLFSTPTLAGYGISKEAETSRRMRHFVKCEHCNFSFLPDYFTNVVIPGWDKPIEEIKKDNIHKTRWKEAYLCCPRCGQDPNMHHSRMEFACENIDENHEANSWFVTPFSAHNRISIPYLVNTSTKFKKYSEFKNQSLGLTAEEASESITEEDIKKAQSVSGLMSANIHQVGVDYGITCNITIGRRGQGGELLVVHRERCHYTNIRQRMAELRMRFRIQTEVHDSQPYSDIVTEFAQQKPTAWGAMFVNTKSPMEYTTQEYEEDKDKARLAMRLVKVNRTATLDGLLAEIKAGNLLVESSEENDIFLKQMRSCKRVVEIDKQGDAFHKWVKTGDHEDHYHMSLMYLYLAIQLRTTAGTPGVLSTGISPIIVVPKRGVPMRTM